MARPATHAEKLGWKFIGVNLGRGGQGEVELVVRTNDPDGPKYAFKFLGDRGGEKAHSRFRQELEGLRKLSHPGIVKIVDYAQKDDDWQYYVMEYLEGAKSLKKRLEQKTNPFLRDPLTAVDGFIQIVEALAACEKAHLVHRDLSPGNVLVTDDAKVMLIDFGLCYFENGNRVTLTDEAVGTPNYRPPECSGNSSAEVSIQSDLYSAGKILWSMITGKIAFDREKPVFNHMALPTILPDVIMSWHFHHIFERTIRMDPHKRFRNAAEALSEAQNVRRLIANQFKPLELLAGDKCPLCGIGTYQLTYTPYQAALDEFGTYLSSVRHAYAVCSYCFHASFVAAKAQRQYLNQRTTLE
jgi:serine/threonine protein kinase